MYSIKKTAAALCAALALSAAAFAAPLSPAEQCTELAKSAMVYNGWFVLPERDKAADNWRYAITDLDHNGRLEVLKVKYGWAPGGPKLFCQELDESGGRLRGEINLDGTDVPDLLATSDASAPVLVLHDTQNNLYHYIFEETIYHGEYESVTTRYALTFSGGKLTVKPLACRHWTLSGYDGSTEQHYYLPENSAEAAKAIAAAQEKKRGTDKKSDAAAKNPLEIPVTRYNAIEQEAFPGCVVESVSLWWRTPDELKEAASYGRLSDALAQSFSSFTR